MASILVKLFRTYFILHVTTNKIHQEIMCTNSSEELLIETVELYKINVILISLLVLLYYLFVVSATLILYNKVVFS